MAVNMQSLPPPLRHLAVSPVNSDNSRNTSTIEADSIEGANVDPSTYSSYSITSSIRDYEVLDGRTYQRTRDGAYIYPNDEAECERLDIHHELNMMIRGDRLHLAPIKGNEKILEIGCGTGAWCIDIGL